jgi:hypothetical protein
MDFRHEPRPCDVVPITRHTPPHNKRASTPPAAQPPTTGRRVAWLLVLSLAALIALALSGCGASSPWGSTCTECVKQCEPFTVAACGPHTACHCDSGRRP